MRAVVQRVAEASVRVAGETVGTIGQGLLVLLGVGRDDADEDARYLAEKIAALRIFEDNEGKMNRSVQEIGGQILVVSQFTLFGDCRKGRRPGFSTAAPPETADRLYLQLVEQLRASGIVVATGIFRSDMDVALINRGPVTMLLDSKKLF